MSTGGTQQSYRVLWAQVVLQAKADVENEPIGSILFNQAVAFFVSRGEWAESRRIIADCLEMHPDDLTRRGERWIAERRQREGLPIERKSAGRGADAALPLPHLVAVPGPDHRGQKPRRATRKVNPFDPYRETASAAAAG